MFGRYTLVVGPNITDNFGNAMAAPFMSNFIIVSERVVNGGFETGDFTGWTIIPAQQGSLFGVSNFEPHSGNFAAYFGGVSPPFRDTIQQSIPTVAGVMYSFSYWLINDGGPANEFRVSWGGVVIQDIVDSAAFSYTQYTFTEMATGSSTVIEFSSYQAPSYFRLDDVSVNPLGAPGAPGTNGHIGRTSGITSQRGIAELGTVLTQTMARSTVSFPATIVAAADTPSRQVLPVDGFFAAKTGQDSVHRLVLPIRENLSGAAARDQQPWVDGLFAEDSWLA
jgi:hypothetical protein